MRIALHVLLRFLKHHHNRPAQSSTTIARSTGQPTHHGPAGQLMSCHHTRRKACAFICHHLHGYCLRLIADDVRSMHPQGVTEFPWMRHQTVKNVEKLHIHSIASITSSLLHGTTPREGHALRRGSEHPRQDITETSPQLRPRSHHSLFHAHVCPPTCDTTRTVRERADLGSCVSNPPTRTTLPIILRFFGATFP